MGKYQQMLSLLMDLNEYHLLPNYHFKESLDDLQESKEIESYCKSVLSNLESLIEANK